MSKIRFKVEIQAELDTDEYAVPTDGKLSLQLKEDITEAIEGSLDIIINNVKITRTSIQHDEVRDND